MNASTGLRELTEIEAHAVELVGNGNPIEVIADVTGLTRAQIAAAVDQAKVLAEQPVPAAPPAVADAVARPARPHAPEPSRVARPAVRPAQALPLSPAHVANWTIDQLLEWADQDGGTKARSLAARLRLLAHDLRALAGQGEAVRKAEAKIASLEAQLKAAKESLRVVKSGQAAPARGASAAQIRSWAAEHGLACPAYGKIPAHVRAAHDAAAGSGASAGEAR